MISAIADLPRILPRLAPDANDHLSYLLISATTPVSTDDASDEVTTGASSLPCGRTFHLQLSEGKRGQLEYLQNVLPSSAAFIKTQLETENPICVCCDNGKDTSVGVVLAALQLFFDDEGNYVKSPEAQASLSKSADKKFW